MEYLQGDFSVYPLHYPWIDAIVRHMSGYTRKLGYHRWSSGARLDWHKALQKLELTPSEAILQGVDTLRGLDSVDLKEPGGIHDDDGDGVDFPSGG